MARILNFNPVSGGGKERGEVSEEKDYIELKWGTLKGWELKTEKAKEAFNEYAKDGISFSAMGQNESPEEKELICNLIDASNCETIYLVWDRKHVSKEEAKEYVMNYGKETQ